MPKSFRFSQRLLCKGRGGDGKRYILSKLSTALRLLFLQCVQNDQCLKGGLLPSPMLRRTQEKYKYYVSRQFFAPLQLQCHRGDDIVQNPTSVTVIVQTAEFDRSDFLPLLQDQELLQDKKQKLLPGSEASVQAEASVHTGASILSEL